MTEQEKELINVITGNGVIIGHEGYLHIARAIIARYPQITKKPLGAKLGETPYGSSSMIAGNCYLVVGGAFFFNSTAERKEWIDSHYVEVVS